MQKRWSRVPRDAKGFPSLASPKLMSYSPNEGEPILHGVTFLAFHCKLQARFIYPIFKRLGLFENRPHHMGKEELCATRRHILFFDAIVVIVY